MNTIELKNILIHRISEITDVSFLEALKLYLIQNQNLLFLLLPMNSGMK